MRKRKNVSWWHLFFSDPTHNFVHIVLRKTDRSRILQLPFAELKSKHWKNIMKLDSKESDYADRICVRGLKKTWPFLRKLILDLWRDDYTRQIVRKLRHDDKIRLPREPSDWSNDKKEEIIRNMLDYGDWSVKIINRLNYYRHSFLDGPLRVGNVVWALTNINYDRPTLLLGRILQVKGIFFWFHFLHKCESYVWKYR